MARPVSTYLALATLSCGAALFSGACSKDDTTDTLDPPTLQIEQIQNAEGAVFKEGEAVELACDARFTVRIGPSEVTKGMLDNWIFRPPRTCATLPNCGYVRLQLLHDDEVLLQLDRSSLNLVVDSDLATLAQVNAIQVDLRDDQTDAVWLVDELPVQARWEVSFAAASNCESAAGGAGGMGNGGANSSAGANSLP